MSKAIRKPKEENGLELMDEDQLQKRLRTAILEVEKKLNQLMGGSESYIFKAPANFKHSELDGNTINIQTTTDLVFLMKALSKMERVERDYNETLSTFDVGNYPVCLWLAVPVTAWIDDLKIIIQRRMNQERIDKLSTSLTQLRQFLSNKEKLRDVLHDLKDLMK